jgi:hypothetical protein
MPDTITARGPAQPKARHEHPVDPARLRRAALLAVRRVGPEEYEVQGQDEPFYYVSLAGDPPCYCADSANRPSVQCKHFLSARLANGDMGLIQMLGNMLLSAAKARGEE